MSFKEVSLDDIIGFISSELRVQSSQLIADTTLIELGCDGDDFDEFILAYSKKFEVKIDNYLWYFHHGEEGINLGRFFIKSPVDRVNRISISLKMLQEFANAKQWLINYPNHHIPKYRYDILIDKAMLAICVIVIFLVSALL